jgi:hypothetical protein
VDLDPAIVVIDLPDTYKKTNLKKDFSSFYFLKVHLHHFSKIKSPKTVTKTVGTKVFLLFLLDDRRIRIRSRIDTSY